MKEFQVGDILRHNRTGEEATVVYVGAGHGSPRVIGLEHEKEHQGFHNGLDYWDGRDGRCHVYPYYDSCVNDFHAEYAKIGHKKVDFAQPKPEAEKVPTFEVGAKYRNERGLEVVITASDPDGFTHGTDNRGWGNHFPTDGEIAKSLKRVDEPKPEEDAPAQWKVGDRYEAPLDGFDTKAGTVLTVKRITNGWVEGTDADGHLDGFALGSWYENHAKRLPAKKEPKFICSKLLSIIGTIQDGVTTMDVPNASTGEPRRGKAHCNPHDKFNADTGMLYAFCRAIGREDVIKMLEEKEKQADGEIHVSDIVEVTSDEPHTKRPEYFPVKGVRGTVKTEATKNRNGITEIEVYWPEGTVQKRIFADPGTHWWIEPKYVKKVQA